MDEQTKKACDEIDEAWREGWRPCDATFTYGGHVASCHRMILNGQPHSGDHRTTFGDGTVQEWSSSTQ